MPIKCLVDVILLEGGKLAFGQIELFGFLLDGLLRGECVDIGHVDEADFTHFVSDQQSLDLVETGFL